MFFKFFTRLGKSKIAKFKGFLWKNSNSTIFYRTINIFQKFFNETKFFIFAINLKSPEKQPSQKRFPIQWNSPLSKLKPSSISSSPTGSSPKSSRQLFLTIFLILPLANLSLFSLISSKNLPHLTLMISHFVYTLYGKSKRPIFKALNPENQIPI